MNRHPLGIELQRGAQETIASAAAKSLPLETGGVLLGYLDNNSVIVTHALIVDGEGATSNRYVRNDIRANQLLAEFLDQRSTDDPTGYIGEWHTHPTPSTPSSMDIAAIREIAKVGAGPVALLVHAGNGTDPFIGLVARRRRFGRVTTAGARVTVPKSRFPSLGPLPDSAVRGDGPVFVSYRQSDGTSQAESLENLLRAAGLVVWRDRTDLRPGTTTDRLEHALTEGLSAAVLVVTQEIVDSEIVRERELPRLLQLDLDPAFSLCVANTIPRSKGEPKCDYDAPDRLLRLGAERTLADKKQANMLSPFGEIEIVRDLLMHRVEQRRHEIRCEDRPFTIRLQTRPAPFAFDADNDDLHIRVNASDFGRLPSRYGLDLLQRTLPITSDAIYAAGAKAMRISGGGHLSIALALGAALPETKFGRIEVLDLHGEVWSSDSPDIDPEISTVEVEIVHSEHAQEFSTSARVAIFVNLTAQADRRAFEYLVSSSNEIFAATAIIAINTVDQIDPRESARLSADIARQIKSVAAIHGRAEVHLAFYGPYTLAVLIGRYLNTLRTVVYEWDNPLDESPRYTPSLTLEPGVSNGPITEVHI